MQQSTATVPAGIASKPSFPVNEKRISATGATVAAPPSSGNAQGATLGGDVGHEKARPPKRNRRKRNKSNGKKKIEAIKDTATTTITAEGNVSADGADAAGKNDTLQNNNTSPTNHGKNNNNNPNEKVGADTAASSPTSLPADLEKIKILEAKLEGAQETIDKLVYDGNDVDIKLATLTDELLAANSKIRRLIVDKSEEDDDNVATLKAKLEQLEKEKAEEAWDFQQEKEEIAQELSAFKEKARVYEEETAVLQSELEDLEAKNSILEKEKEEHAASLVKTEKESFDAKLEELEKAMKDENIALLAEIEILKSNCAVLEKDKQATETALSQIKSMELPPVDNTEELEALREENQKLATEVETLMSKCDVLEKDKEATETALSQMKSMELPPVDNTEELEALRDENQKLAVLLKDAQRQLDGIQENFAKDQAQLEHNLQLAHDAQMQQAVQEHASLETELHKTKQALAESIQNAQAQLTSRAAPAEEDKVTKIWQEKLVAKAKELKDTEKRLKALEADKRELESQLEKVAVEKKPWWLCG
jgi:chromosome segregation ATPase